MENKAIKNMEYFKKKNNIPGIDTATEAGMGDGRATSAPFQMKEEDSPNKFIGGAISALGKTKFGQNIGVDGAIQHLGRLGVIMGNADSETRQSINEYLQMILGQEKKD